MLRTSYRLRKLLLRFHDTAMVPIDEPFAHEGANSRKENNDRTNAIQVELKRLI